MLSSAASSNVTLRFVLDEPIRPMRRALPLNGPRPPPISIPYSSQAAPHADVVDAGEDVDRVQ
jgi:hypothetical protein